MRKKLALSHRHNRHYRAECQLGGKFSVLRWLTVCSWFWILLPCGLEEGKLHAFGPALAIYPSHIREQCQPSGRGNSFLWSRWESLKSGNWRSVRDQITDNERQFKVVEKNRLASQKKTLESSTLRLVWLVTPMLGNQPSWTIRTTKTQYEADELFMTLDATTRVSIWEVIFRLPWLIRLDLSKICRLNWCPVSNQPGRNAKHVDLLVSPMMPATSSRGAWKTVPSIMKDLTVEDYSPPDPL